MNEKGVIYYNRGTKCCLRMLVSIFSLRRHYKGPVTVMIEGEQDQWFVDRVRALNYDRGRAGPVVCR